MWNFFGPLFGDHDNNESVGDRSECKKGIIDGKDDISTAAGLALSIIIHNFKPSLLKCRGNEQNCNFYFQRCRKCCGRPTKTLSSEERSDHGGEKNGDNCLQHLERVKPKTWSESNFQGRRFEKIRKKTIKKETTPKDQFFLTIYILPPLQSPNLRPERIFTSLLVKLENLQIRLQSLNAYIATLGGGYFLCHFLSTAVCLARYQRLLAFQLNDFNLAMKCTINEAYNYIHAGMIENALILIQQTEDMTTRRKKGLCISESGEENTVISMCKAARWFAERVRDGMVAKNRDSNGNMCKLVLNDLQRGANSATHDDFQRIRVVRDRTVSKRIR